MIFLMSIVGAKISIIGAGFVGSTTAFTLAMANLCAEIVIVSRNRKKARAEALDIAHGTCSETPVKVIDGDYADTKNSDIVIFTAGIGPKVGQTRLDLLHNNVEILKDIIPSIIEYSPNCILLMVSNPVDILTYVAYKLSGLSKERVIGSGTIIDTARLRLLLRRRYELSLSYIHTMVLGEHGDSQVVAWSQTTVAGTHIEDYFKLKGLTITDNDKKIIADQVCKLGIEEIVSGKGYTNFGIAACVKRIVKSILMDENAVLPITVLATGEYGLNDVCLALPSIVSGSGVADILTVPLYSQELSKLQQSADALAGIIKQLSV